MLVRGGVKGGGGASPSAAVSAISKLQATGADANAAGPPRTPAVDSAQVRVQLANMSILGSHFGKACPPVTIVMPAMGTAASALNGAAATASVTATKMAISRTEKLRMRPGM